MESVRGTNHPWAPLPPLGNSYFVQHLRTGAEPVKTDNQDRLCLPRRGGGPPMSQSPHPGAAQGGAEGGCLPPPQPRCLTASLSWKNEVAHSCCESRLHHPSPSLPLQAVKTDSAPQRTPAPGQLAVAGPPALTHLHAGTRASWSSEYTTLPWEGGREGGRVEPQGSAWPGPTAALS